jgi:hypothetical protein
MAAKGETWRMEWLRYTPFSLTPLPGVRTVPSARPPFRPALAARQLRKT